MKKDLVDELKKYRGGLGGLCDSVHVGCEPLVNRGLRPPPPGGGVQLETFLKHSPKGNPSIQARLAATHGYDWSQKKTISEHFF